MNYKYKISGILLFLWLMASAFPVLAQQADDSVNIYFFESDTCPHCAKEKIFLEKLKQEDPNIQIYEFEITKNKDNLKLFQQLAKELSINIPGVPATFIGEHYFFGYQNDEIHGELIKQLIKEHRENKCPDIAGPIIAEFRAECAAKEKSQISMPEKISLPFIGEIKIKNFSLPAITVIFGLVDGFNPCAMWVLIFLISLLLGMKNRKRMWILGGAFIAVSAAVYFVFLAAWLNFFIFVGFIYWVRVAVGIGALAMGGYYLRKYFKDKAGVCEIEESGKKQKIINRLKAVAEKEKFWTALAGIIMLAAVVNLFELLCSIGLPAIYTNILILSDLSPASYYLYLLLYIFFFMLDDLLIFVIAMITLRAVGLTKKYSRFSSLIGGILIFIIGLLLIFKPEWLMFG